VGARKSVAVFVGTRPEGIKLAPVIAALKESGDLDGRVIATGQHREMFRQVADEFGFAAHADLGVMVPGQTLAGLTARLMDAIDGWLAREPPDFALVQGDTTTVFVAALACFYRGIPVGHVEAGLRTNDVRSPFPEEANRRLASTVVTLHFAPTESARAALLREGVAAGRIEVTGNTVVDALLRERARQEDPSVRAEIQAALAPRLGADWETEPLVLVTGHRRESFGEGIRQICEAIATLAQRHPDHRFVYPVHLNPEVKGHVERLLGGIPNVRLIAPQGYRCFVALMAHARLILTDSGGVQEEAPSLGRPVLVMRDTTERREAIDAGMAILTGARAERIVAEAGRLLADPGAWPVRPGARNPYGDGHAAERIVRRVRQYLAEAASPT
jgi:UDP-N-acetylglucosamine 2-epimerase (non-hydrolysing)